MEYCNGKDLDTILEHPENAYGLSDSEFLLILKNLSNINFFFVFIFFYFCVILANGLSELRRLKISNCKINSQNILLDIQLDGSHVYKISDFGFAKHYCSSKLVNFICGSPEYLNPKINEQLIFNETINYTSQMDLWSIGVTLYQIATGRLPFIQFDSNDKKTLYTIYFLLRYSIEFYVAN